MMAPILAPVASQKGTKRPRSVVFDGGEKKFSSYCGVSFDKRAGKWQAGIMIQGKRSHLGSFHSDEEAARAYDETAALHGKPMNFPLLEGQEQAVKPAARKKQEVSVTD